MTGFAGKSVAIVGPGGERVRSVAVVFAESGADLALGTQARTDEFAMASIANEVWVLGNEQFLRVMDFDDVDAADADAQARLFTLYNRLRERGGTLVAAGDEETGALAARKGRLAALARGVRIEVVAMALPGEEAAVLVAAAPQG
jgi:D-arabinose 1-dehydrogenase-like Zn-dependent alcohol dehydrogenase